MSDEHVVVGSSTITFNLRLHSRFFSCSFKRESVDYCRSLARTQTTVNYSPPLSFSGCEAMFLSDSVDSDFNGGPIRPVRLLACGLHPRIYEDVRSNMKK